VGLLLRNDSWRAASDAVVDACSSLRPLLGREQACAALCLTSTALSLLFGLLSRSVVAALVAPVALVLGVPLWASSMARKRTRALAAEMPEVLRSLALALSSGETLAQAIDYVGTHARGPAAHAFSRVSMRMRCGDSTREALELLTDELDVPRVDLLVTALLVSQRTGSPLRSLLQTSAELAERQGELERLLEVKTAQVRLSARVVCLLPLVLVGLLSLISADFQAGVMTPAGALCVLIAMGMDGLALLIVRRLMRGVL
jgi:tight adherence protein B